MNFLARSREFFFILVTFLAAVFSLSSGVQAGLPTHDSAGEALPSLAPMLKQVNPAVVNISTFSIRQTYNPLRNDPFFQNFFNMPERRYRRAPQKRQQSAGSGVIVDAKNGIVITNYHVVKGADEVEVSLVDGRNFTAKIKGVDPELDIAVLEIEAKDLTAVKLADSNKLQVGDFVIAIGNPFGIGQTVTTGIVSALGRTGLGIEGYENFIQTDASINPGNSGGALVNLRGELIGINTAIIAPSGGNVGIGFAIPINMARSSADQILEHGVVRRGYIGISTQDITSDLRDAFNLASGQTGVLITNVDKNSPAKKGGLRSGDIIISIDNDSTRSTPQWRSQLGVKAIGEKISLAIIREGREQNIRVEIGPPRQLLSENGKIHPLLDGIRFEEDPDRKGVVVVGLSPRSPAAYSGLRPGDVIYRVNRARVSDLESLVQAVRRNRREILVEISRGGKSYYLVLR